MSEMQKRTWAEISLDNIEYNYRSIMSCLPEGCKFLGVVKADAYGHGAMQVAHRLEKAGADYLAVSCLDEALELRRSGVTMGILILGHTPCEYLSDVISNNITQTVSCEAKAIEYSQAAEKLGKTLKIHIKLDTGMSRLGYLCDGRHFEEGVKNVVRSCKMNNLDAEGIFTHFAVSDETDEASKEYTLNQYKLFCDVISECEKAGISFKIRHCANSGAVVNYPEMAMDMVRPGLLLYGYGDTSGKLDLKPAMRLVTTVSTIKTYDEGTSVSYGRKYTTDKTTRTGVIGIGYADGLPRASSNKCSFYTNSGMVRQIGTICMDMCMVDLNGMSEVSVGDRVEIFGDHADINKISDAAGTIPYELLCNIAKRVPRIYTNI